MHYRRRLQTHVPQVMPMLAPYVNSYRRLSRLMSAPINVQWGYDNCTSRHPRSALGAKPTGASRTACPAST